MPVQRKVFRIEEGARANAQERLSTDEAEGAMRHHEFIAELKALRALIEPRSQMDRETMERARAQIAEAQAYRQELELINAALRRTKDEIHPLDTDAASGRQIAHAGRELRAIVAGTEQATQSILQAAEDIDQTAGTLAAVLKSSHEQGLAHDMQDRVVQIFEACNFQDLTGQRVAKVAAALRFVEDHVARLMEIWHRIEEFKPIVLDESATSERRFLNGPKLAGEPGHSSQDDIDQIFGCA